MQQAMAGFGLRLTAAGARVLTDRRLLWGLVVVFAVRRFIAEIPVWVPDLADVHQFIAVGRVALRDPGSIYPGVADQVAHSDFATSLYPPPQLLLAALYALAPIPLAETLWVATNLVAAAVAVAVLFRMVARIHPAAPPVFWLIVLCFTPLFEDLRLGQRGGVLIMLGVLAMATVRTRPVLAGVLAGLVTSLKFYPAAMVFGVNPRKQWRFIVSLVGTSVAVLGVSFIPFGSPLFYLLKVLIPSITWQNSGAHDCFQNSTPLLFARVVGGEPFTVGNNEGIWHPVTLVPWHLTTLATVLTLATIAGIFAATFWAVWRSGFAQPYSLALCFSLGTLVPGEVFTYQFLPMLPLLLIVFMQALRHARFVSLAVLGVALWVLVASPCALALPSLWTVAALAIFAVAVAMAPLFRAQGLAATGADHTLS
jgi:Glycosyltransferase family 87